MSGPSGLLSGPLDAAVVVAVCAPVAWTTRMTRTTRIWTTRIRTDASGAVWARAGVVVHRARGIRPAYRVPAGA
ncbi:hypothetical protein GCM10010507_31620 [Streptomyces cinnamoneus]|uniref:Uncharacterized protein n=1 Tax=Streptomyces cinnamoneus TaxID=53446 RepID=A0A918WL73_STRCJ|nr:hypothetical protein GCM10010507_31620 [Streptomyces cinnamoneus]